MASLTTAPTNADKGANSYEQSSLKIFVTNLRDFDNHKDFKRLLNKHKIN